MKSLIQLIITMAIVILPFFGWSQIVPCTVTLDATLGGAPPVPQVYNMANGTNSTCSGVFYDPGGTGNYSNSTGLITMTFCSDQPGEQIILDFSAYGFQVETNYDFLNIYDGTGTGGTQLWNSQTSGGSTNPGVITSTTGCLTITFSSDGSVNYQGWQADISCTNATTAIFDCNGGDVALSALGQGQQTTVMSNNFNAGLGAGWVSTGGSSVGSPCGPSLDGTDYYWASTSTGTPNLTTIDYDVSCGGMLTFDMAYATQGGAAPCEGPDLPNEGVTLQYSTDGGLTWILIQYWDPLGGYDPQMTAWNNYSIPIPIGAQGPNTQFQWVQNNSSGTCCDNWGIDNVMITANTNCNAYWYDYNHIPGFPDPQNDVVNITSTTTFGVWYTNGTDSCYASTTVIVPPGTTADAGPDQTICAAGSVTIGAAPITPDAGATYTWSSGATGIIGTGDNGQVSVSPLVTTTYFLEVEYNGCIAYDTVTVFVDAPPTASNPAPINVECSGDVPMPDPLVVTDENDDITLPPSVTFLNDVSDGQSCPETITRTYRVEDACGNFVDVEQTITIIDTEAPVFNTTPATLNVQCSGDIPAMINLAWTDNCDGLGAVAGSDVSDGQSCPETITRTWTYSDACGNAATETQIITVNDTQAPVFNTPPSTMNVQCSGDIPAMTNLVWTDNCDGTGTIAGNDVSDGQSCPETITRTWTYSDVCGNSATETQIITVNDTQAPVFNTPPSTMNVQCSGDIPAMTNLAWTDNCDGTGTIPGSDVSDGQSCPETITRTWTYSDACGNAATETQIITVNDTQAPVFSTPPSILTVECAGDVPAMVNLVWTDNCDGTGTIAGNDVSDGQSCPETITRTWTYTDACGNAATETQTIIVDDTTPPTASNPAPISITGGVPVPNADPLVVNDEADNCTVNPTVAFVSDVSDNGNCPEIITRTYSITDDCGNQSLVTQLISIGDAVLPTASNPTPISVQCSGDVPAQDPLVVTDEADNGMMPPVVTFESEVSDGQSCPETITRTYRVTDDCGNYIFVTQIITVNDTQEPVFSAPPVASNVQCQGDIPAMTNLGWTDNCDGSGTIAGNDVSDGQSCPETITRTWTYTDACGNAATETQIITVLDTQAPTISAPPVSVTVECAGDVPAMTNLNWTDNCDGSGMIAGNDVSDGQSCPETITRTWTYTDACGNAATETQTIIVDDTTPPTASNLATISILGGMPLPIIDPLVVNDEADNCTTSPVVAFVSDVSNNGNCPEIVTRTYSITDDCGNQSFVTQLISIGDAISPSASNPTPINVQCSGDVPAPDPLVVTDETDNGMMPPVVTFENDASDGQSCPETITRTYRVTDDCGNFIFVTQAITVHDTQAPVFNAPPVALSVQCQGDVPAMADLGWMDNCDGSGMATGNDVSDGQSCPETITRTWTYTDACGNSATETQIITVQDTIAPVMDVTPVDITVACIGDVPVMLNLGWTDNCDGTGTVTGNDVSDGLSCPETITRTWMHTDACGNMSTTSQTITVFDTLAPTASAPATANVECIGDVPVWDVTAVTNVADNCSSNPIVAFVSDVSDGLSCPETITRTYSVTDDCGNSETFDQLIIVNDVTAPTASNPAPVSVPGAGDVPVPDALVVIDELDNCTTYPTVAWVSDLSDGNVCNGEIITRTYSITDDCGNQSFVTQEITILAAPAPIDAGPDQTICAGDMVTIAALNPWNAQLSWSPTLPSGPFAPTQTTTYTCTADNEGCMSTDQITITIEEPPLVSFMGDVLSGCAPHTVTFTNTSSSVSGMADCIWNINGQTVSACNTGAYTFDTPGTYDVTLTTTSLTGCTATETYSQYIYVEGNPEASFTASQTELSTMFTEVSFDNTSQGASSYTWTFGDNSGMSTEENPSHTYPETPGTYNVELTAYSNLGCMDVTSLVITVNEELIYYIPNSFTPDGDDYNESFSPVFTEGYDPFDFHMMIYNRWGEIVWESYDASVGWDGTYGYGGSLVQDGTYTWHIEFKVNGNDERKLIAGHVNVLR